MKNKLLKKSMAILMTLAMVISLLPAMTITASAADATGTITTSSEWTKAVSEIFVGVTFGDGNIWFSDLVATNGGNDSTANIYLDSKNMSFGGHDSGTYYDGTETIKFTASVAGTYSFNVCSDVTGTGTKSVQITVTGGNTAPSFVGASTLTVAANAPATDIKSLLHVSDSDSSQDLTWTQNTAPTNGTLTITEATASSGSTNVIPGGTITYKPTAGYSGSDYFTVQVSDGTATATRTINVTVNSTTNIVTEHFADEAPGAFNFTNTDFSFNLQGGNFKIANIDTYGWTGTDVDAYYVDNEAHLLTSAGVVGSIQIASGTFRAHSIYVFPGENNLEVKSTGTVIIRGKLGGDTKFSRTVASNEINLFSPPDNGYTFVDLSAYNTIAIDTLEFELTGALRYLAIDAFKHESTAVSTNAAPTLTTISKLTDATEDTAYEITYDALAAAANEADADGDTLSFRVEAVTTGTLTKNGAAVTAGTTTLSSVEKLVWTPAANANGDLNAFTVKAYDSKTVSATAVQVVVNAAAVNDNPGITGLPSDITVTESTASNVDLSAATFSDVDAGVGTVTLTLTVGAGALSATDTGTLTFGGSATALTLSGTVSAIDTYLNNPSNIKYKGVEGAFGNNVTTLILTANDGGNTGTGGGTTVALGTVNIDITAGAPTVTSVSSSTVNGTYGIGKVIEISVNFSNTVTVTGTPKLVLNTVAGDRTASYDRSSGSTLTFTYTTQAGDETTDLDYKAIDSLILDGGAIKRGTTDAVLTLPVPGTVGSISDDQAIVISAFPTVALSVGTPSIVENGGTSTITATLSAISSQDVVVTLTYSGTATSGTDYNGTASTTITIPKGSLFASAAIGITAIDDADPEGNETIKIDISGVSKGIEDGTQQQTITILDDDIARVTSVSSSNAVGSYRAGDIITITVEFSHAVTVTPGLGVPQLLLETGTQDRVAEYTSGSGSNTLTFVYTIQAGDTSSDLNYAATDSLTLNGSTITKGGQAASLVLPALNSGSSLAGQEAIVIDTTVPTVPAISTATQTINADSITINGTAEAGATITITGGAATATGVALGGNYSMRVNLRQDTVNTLVVKATDAAGNSSTTTSVAITEDSISPSVPVISTLVQTINADSITINGTAEAGATITITGGAATATGTAVGGNYSISVNLTQDAVNTLVIKATDAAGNNSATESVVITEDSVVPTIPVSTIAVSDISSSTVKLTWEKAEDIVTAQANLMYKLVYSTSDITTVLAAEAANMAKDWTTDITNFTVTGLNSNTDYHFNVLVKDEAGNKALYNVVTGKTTIDATGEDTSTVVEVDGKKQDAGTKKTETTGGQTVTTITVDDKKLDKLLETSGEKPKVTLPSVGSDVTVGELNGQTIKNMENKEAVLEIKTDSVTYTLPASQINIGSVSSQIGSQVALKDIKVSVSIAAPSADTVKIVQDTAKKGNYQLVVKPVEFTIMCTSGDKTVTVSKFNGYVERTVAIPDGVDPAKITTGIVLNADGTFSHVPTTIVKIGDKYYAKINSLTNSTYSVIYNPVTFTDVANHWAKTAINDMGSRMVVTGVGSSTYEPDRGITRAEVAAVVIRALGLQKGATESRFGDVTLTDWFNGYVDTATEYSLITGYDSTSYGPNDQITREQAMAIIARAMKLTNLSVSLTDSEVSTLLAKYTDGTAVSDYAKTSTAMCLKTGVVTGASATTLSPKAYVTRAEIAVMVQRMLQKSGLN